MSENLDGVDTLPDAMTVTQLARRAGVPTRRIRYYVSEGLLPPPHGRGRAAHYTTQHLETLQQITALREVNLSLDQIRARLDGIADATPAPEAQPVPSHRWRRWEIVPGVELHAREDLDDEQMSTIRVMVGAVRHVLEHGIEIDDEGVDDSG